MPARDVHDAKKFSADPVSRAKTLAWEIQRLARLIAACGITSEVRALAVAPKAAADRLYYDVAVIEHQLSEDEVRARKKRSGASIRRFQLRPESEMTSDELRLKLLTRRVADCLDKVQLNKIDAEVAGRTLRELADELGRPDDTAPAPPNRKGYLPGELSEMFDISSDTLRTYAKAAGVKTPGRGAKNHRYSRSEAHRIALQIANGTTNSDMRARCLKAAENLK